MASLPGWLTLAGLMTAGFAVVLRFLEVAYPIPITLLGLGTGCFLVAGIPWAHMPGNRRSKAATMGLVGFAVGGAAGFFLGDAVAPHRPDDIAGILYNFAGLWVGGILLAVVGVKWVFLFHRRYAAEPGAAADGGRDAGMS